MTYQQRLFMDYAHDEFVRLQNEEFEEQKKNMQQQTSAPKQNKEQKYVGNRQGRGIDPNLRARFRQRNGR